MTQLSETELERVAGGRTGQFRELAGGLRDLIADAFDRRRTRRREDDDDTTGGDSIDPEPVDDGSGGYIEL